MATNKMKTENKILIAALTLTSLSASAQAEGEACSTHTLTYHDAVPAQCDKYGCAEYWSCNVCHKNFLDENASTEIADLTTIYTNPLNQQDCPIEPVEHTSTYKDETGYLASYFHASSQNLYLKEEIGAAGRIDGYAFYCSGLDEENGSIARTIKVYLKETSSSSISKDAPFDPAQMTLVYDGTITIGKDLGWEPVLFTTQFEYSGEGNLVIAIYSSASTWNHTAYYCHTSSGKSIVRTGDRSAYSDPSDLEGFRSNDYRNDILFMVTPQGHTFENLNTTTGFCTCTKCNASVEPETLTSVTLTDDPENFEYQRTTPATVTGSLTYSRAFSPDEMCHWQPLYMPLSARYDAAGAEQYDIAEIYTYGVAGDTNNDGVVDARDEKKMIVRLLDLGETIVANTPYLIWPKTILPITFTSCDGKLSAATAASVECGTMMETFTFTGNYAAATAATGKYVLADDVLKPASGNIAPFRWYMSTQASVPATGIALYEMSSLPRPTNAHTVTAEITGGRFLSAIYTTTEGSHSVRIPSAQAQILVPDGATLTLKTYETAETSLFLGWRNKDKTQLLGKEKTIEVKIDGDSTLVADYLAVVQEGSGDYKTEDKVTIPENMPFYTPVGFTAPGAIVDREFKPNTPATLSVPFEAPVSYFGDVTIYAFAGMTTDAETGKLTVVMEEKDADAEIQANEPVIVIANISLENVTISSLVTFPASHDIQEQLSTAVTASDGTQWIFQALDNYKAWTAEELANTPTYGFAGRAQDGYSIGDFARLGVGAYGFAGKCVMTVTSSPNGAPARNGEARQDALPETISVRFVGAEETGIATLDLGTGAMSTVQWFDLNGRPIDAPRPGQMGITGGKKAIVRN